MLFDFKKWKNSKPWDFRLKFSWINTISTVLFCACFIMVAIREICFWFFPEYLNAIKLPFIIAVLIAIFLLIVDQIVDSLDERKYKKHVKKFTSMRKSAPPYNLDNALKSRPFEEAVCECFEDSARELSERPEK